MTRLELALADAARVALPASNPAYVQARAFYESESGFWNKTLVAWGETCTALTEEANQAASRLNDQIQMMGGAVSPPFRPDFQTPGPFSAVPPWAWPIIIVAGLGAVAYTTGSVAKTVSVFAPRRQLSGTNKRRRRRRR